MKECKGLSDKAFGTHLKESTIFDVSLQNQNLVITPSDSLHFIGPPQVELRAYASHAKVIYGRSSAHLGNSLVALYANGDVSKPPSMVGSNKYVYTVGGMVQLAVQPQLAPLVGISNPFARYREFPATVYSMALYEKLERVEPSWIVGHYGLWDVSNDICIFGSLLRVIHSPSKNSKQCLIFLRSRTRAPDMYKPD